MTSEEKRRLQAVGVTKRSITVALIAGCFSGVLFLGGAIVNSLSNNESGWVIVLFSIPFLAQLTGLLALYFVDREESFKATFCDFYAVTMGMSTSGYCLLWIAYLRGWTGAWLSPIALLVVLLLASVVMIVTFAIMRRAAPTLKDELGQEVSDWMDRLREGLVLMPFWALLHFFAIFLSVAFGFGFALAFHDRGLPAHEVVTAVGRASDTSSYQALHASQKTCESGDDSCWLPPLYKPRLGFHKQPSSVQEQKQSSSAKNERDGGTAVCFYFREGKAELEAKAPSNDEEIVKTNEESDFRRKRANYKSLEALVRAIKSSESPDLPRITLIGRANEKSIKPGADPYLSNYELSEARTHDVWYTLSKELIQEKYDKWRNIEWMMLPMSNEQTTANGAARVSCTERLQDPAKVVEASIEYISNDPTSVRLEKDGGSEFERLDLMGYMYFAIYTITTTGYGDIIPTTAYAKFVASLANVFAIFFLVGFINALISLKSQKKEE